MDADWGSSSDEEDAAERARKDKAKLDETMALLDAFNKTKPPEQEEEGYGSVGERFRNERAQAAGKAMWNDRRAVMNKDAEDIQDINSSFKWHIIMGVVIIGVLGFALVGLYNQFNETVKNSSGNHWLNATHGQAPTSGAGGTAKPVSRMPPVGVIAFVFIMGFGIPTAVLVWRQLKSKKQRQFQAEV
uniref:Uncharacterized protein n=1 Tax=Hemiselmis andersenii TaxID=464988 RepID=A0A6T8JY25_HEMAN|mmetsp:Transcript_7885/g.18195  ORF Transcript_7885/g.18195 Transcript_7885/m.18195 type:complete len:188 (-) Transcript_7885:929-1492(-)|eukprot:CAMPEP_0114119774 /NCGR_PEP_ID=MMETSP0043_2-20121206/6291_1 /TAXON_ID=464988 /ORGANISM="Hemiselmis andersenii, Strain CCMP644" /LENGTH=187 /DNA_ID=CAMNT_0001212345 /DNA_START=129 /DNA_END=692 /DNA_ORIENTATION=-